ncbi:MAG: DUF3971 domain-containing protein [Hyphomonadaceae bacterium]|nr:DUF3971 domain-containing protein [Hyphomonadaceae bacterium]
MVRKTARLIVFEILGGILFLAVIAAALLAWRLSQGPLELSVYKDDIEQALTEARGGRGVAIERVELQWSPERRRMDVTAEGVVFYTDEGLVGGRADFADLELDASALLFGDITLVGLGLRGGEIEIRQLSSDTWSIAGETLPPIPAADLPETPAEWLASLNRVLGGLLNGGKAFVDTVQLKEVTFQEMALDVYLQSGARVARLENTGGSMSTRNGDLVLTLSSQGVDAGLPEQLSLDVRSHGEFESLSVDLSLAGWTLSELAVRMGVSEDRVSGLPARFTLAFQATRDAGLTSVAVRGEAGAGAVRIAGYPVAVTRVDGEVNYDTGSDTLDFALAGVDAGIIMGEVSGSLGDAVFGESDRPLSLRAPQLRVDATPMFERPWQLADLEVDARLSPDLHGLVLDRANLVTGGARLQGRGSLSRNLDPAEDELPLSLNLVAEMTGETGKRTVLDFWPVFLGESGRQFVETNVEAGRLVGATVRVDLQPTSMALGYLEDDALEVDFTVREADVVFLSDMPGVTQASGTGRLTGNTFSAEISQGAWHTWTLDSGSVRIPAFNPKGGDIIIEAGGRGPVRDAVDVIFNSELNLEEETGFDPDRLSGRGDVTFRMTRPALDDVTLDDMTFSVTGQVRDAGLSDIAAGFSLAESTARVDLTKARIAISGFGKLGPAMVNFEWRDDFEDEDGPSRLTAQSTVTPDVLNQFGLLGRPYVTGEVPVQVNVELLGETVEASIIDLDFTSARIDLAEIGWLKPSGDAASAHIQYRTVEGVRSAEAALESATLKLAGDILLSETGRLISADLDRAYLAGRADVSGEMLRDVGGGLSLSLRGPLLDLSGLLPGAGDFSSTGSMDSTITVDAEVEELVLGEALTLQGARLAAISSGEGLQSMTAAGTIRAGAALDVSFRREQDGTARVELDADDAGALIQTFFETDTLVGGRLELDGVLRGADEATDYNIRIQGARLRDAPFLTQILSIASLRGLADTLGGEGVLFSQIELPIRTREGRYVIDGGRASGPALGLTVNGWVEPETGGISLNGVLVPSFGVNSALGGIPIIGDLFVSREGEGVFSLTYSVRGELSRAQVAVNPLSAITPGVLRRIFENPTSTELPLPEEEGEEVVPSE